MRLILLFDGTGVAFKNIHQIIKSHISAHHGRIVISSFADVDCVSVQL